MSTSLSTSSNGTSPSNGGRWTFFTNHTHVLVLLYSEPGIVLREVAQRVGITERAVQRIVHELEEENFLKRERVGRRNEYQVLVDNKLRHPIESHCSIDDLMSLIVNKQPDPKE